MNGSISTGDISWSQRRRLRLGHVVEMVRRSRVVRAALKKKNQQLYRQFEKNLRAAGLIKHFPCGLPHDCLAVASKGSAFETDLNQAFLNLGLKSAIFESGNGL